MIREIKIYEIMEDLKEYRRPDNDSDDDDMPVITENVERLADGDESIIAECTDSHVEE